MGQGGRMYSWCWSSQSRSSQMVFLLGNMPLCAGANMLGSYCFCAAITKCSYSPRTAALTHPHVQYVKYKNRHHTCSKPSPYLSHPPC